jgi:YHS domain-containing protein
MIRHFYIFLGTFVVGAFIALVARAAWFEPHADPGPASNSTVTHAATPNSTSSPQPDAVAHEGHTAPAVTPVNTVCAICGMEVDPELPTATFQGKTIGFGCRACPAKFKANPERYGPAALRNEVVKS